VFNSYGNWFVVLIVKQLEAIAAVKFNVADYPSLRHVVKFKSGSNHDCTPLSTLVLRLFPPLKGASE
jgi:hypothetical protein